MPNQRATKDLLVLYTFEEGSGNTVNDVSGTGTPLDLTIQNGSTANWVDGGLSFTSSNLAVSPGPATKIIDACMASNAISIEAWIKPANTAQSGPARMVTLSPDPGLRNFTLGQSATEYDVRLRTPNTGTQGNNPSLSTSSGATTIQLSHVLYVRNTTGLAKIYVDGVEKVSGAINGDFSNWDSSYRFGLANELTQDRPWLGEFHLVAIYNRALDSAEVLQNFSAGPSGQSSLTVHTKVNLPHHKGIKLSVYPNPFNPVTTIRIINHERFAIRDKLEIYDLTGRLIEKLIPNFTSPRTHLSFNWYASSNPSGVYIAKLSIGRSSSTKQLMLMK